MPGIKGAVVCIILFFLINPPVLRGAEPVVLKILDINVWSGLDYKGIFKMGEYESPAQREKRYQALIQQIKALDPDVIGAHELNQLPGYARRLAADIGYDVFFHPGLGGIRLGCIGLPRNLREGDGIFIKKSYRAEFTGRQQLSGGPVGRWASCHFSDATQIIAVKLILKGEPVYVFATHWHASLDADPQILNQARELYYSGDFPIREYLQILARIDRGIQWRLSEARQTISFIRQTAGEAPCILMGDFNARYASREIQKLVGNGLIDLFNYCFPASHGYTWDPQTNINQKAYYTADSIPTAADLSTRLHTRMIHSPRRIDYIFFKPESLLLSGQVDIVKTQVVMQQVIAGVQASDHYGIYAEIEFKNLD